MSDFKVVVARKGFESESASHAPAPLVAETAHEAVKVAVKRFDEQGGEDWDFAEETVFVKTLSQVGEVVGWEITAKAILLP